MGTKVYLKKERKGNGRANGKTQKRGNPCAATSPSGSTATTKKPSPISTPTDTLTDYIDHPQGHSVDFWRGIAYWDKHIQRETEETGEDWVGPEAFLFRGIAYYETGNTEKALVNFDNVVHYFKQPADAKYYKALILVLPLF